MPVARLAAVLSGLAAITANPPPTEPIHLGALVDTLPSDAPAVRAAPGLVYPAYLARLITLCAALALVQGERRRGQVLAVSLLAGAIDALLAAVGHGYGGGRTIILLLLPFDVASITVVPLVALISFNLLCRCPWARARRGAPTSAARR